MISVIIIPNRFDCFCLGNTVTVNGIWNMCEFRLCTVGYAKSLALMLDKLHIKIR